MIQIVVGRIVVKQSPLLRVALLQAVAVQIVVGRIVVIQHFCPEEWDWYEDQTFVTALHLIGRRDRVILSSEQHRDN